MILVRRFLLAWGPLAPVAAFLLFTLVMLSCSRLLLVAWQWSRVAAVDGLWPVLGYGLRFDIIVSCWFIVLPVLVDLLLPPWQLVQRIWRTIEAGWFALLFGLLVYMEVATPSFIKQYDTRPNRIFFEYLKYPKEVFATLWADYKLQLFLGAVLLCLGIWVVWRACRNLQGEYSLWRWWVRLLVLPLVGALIFLGARSSFDHRPANISKAAFSSDQLVNRLGVSSTYSLIYAISNIPNEGRADRIYEKLDTQIMFQQIRKEIGLSDASAMAEIPTLHLQKPVIARERPLNIVIILQESIGADFVGALGGENWTPEWELLAKEGLWLSNLYATGTRSVRGIEAVTTGFPPSPGRSVVKLGLAQQNFFTIAELLKRQGYATSFIYGGESHFDNMRGFFLGNGFDRVIDQEDYSEPNFVGTWGVSDGDLFDRADEEYSAAGAQPFFSLIFTSSNHDPFDIPAGVVKADAEGDAGRLEAAVRYADYAMGRFFEKAQKSPYWENTLFLVVADHSKSVSGQSLVPIKKFHIPGLFIGPGVTPGTYDKIASQIDLPVTLLSLAGIESAHPMIGRDLMQVPPDDPGRAIMQFNLNHATMVGDQVVIHQPHLEPRQFRYEDEVLQPETADAELIRRASALALWPSHAYFNQQYRLPKE